jgi:hypothetical protein
MASPDSDVLELAPYATALLLADIFGSVHPDKAGELAADPQVQQLLRLAIGGIKYGKLEEEGISLASAIQAMVEVSSTFKYDYIVFELLRPLQWKHILEAAQLAFKAVDSAA